MSNKRKQERSLTVLERKQIEEELMKSKVKLFETNKDEKRYFGIKRNIQ